MSRDVGEYVDSLLTTQHAVTMRASTQQIAADLRTQLGPTLTAYIANVRSRQLPPRWADGSVEPGPQAEQRLIFAHQVFGALTFAESADVARAWLIGANPFFGGRPPAELIREGEFTRVMGALRNFLESGGHGGA